MKTVLIHGRVVTPYRTLENHGVAVEDGRITEIFAGEYTQPADTVIDVENRYISPGFIDLHTHGGGGSDYMDGTADGLINAVKTHMRHGTTSIMPTSTTSTMEELYGMLDSFSEAKRIMTGGPNLLGVHMEGPYVSTERHGGQDIQYLRTPYPEEIKEVLRYSPYIARVSAAPEIPYGMELGRTLRDHGILASIGHSAAMYEKVLEACENGYSLVTHFYSGNSTLQRITHRRELGIIETAYLIDGLNVELISDGIHLPPELLRLILRGKNSNQIILTTDSSRGVDLPEGTPVRLGSMKNGQDGIVEGGVCMMMHRMSYGGSTCTTDRAVRTMVQQIGVRLEDAVRMISLNPARLAGAKTKGIISVGMDADLCVFDEEIRIGGVMVMGEMTVNELKTTQVSKS